MQTKKFNIFVQVVVFADDYNLKSRKLHCYPRADDFLSALNVKCGFVRCTLHVFDVCGYRFYRQVVLL